MTSPTTALVLRTCAADGTSYNGFQWPTEVGAVVSAPDWQPTAECGYGLHGALWGEGDGSLFSWQPDAKWMVVEVEAATIIDLSGKVKFPSCVIRHIGDQLTATAFLAERLPMRAQPFMVIGGTATAGDCGTATAGDGGTATAGDCGTATAGDGGTIFVRWWDGNRSRFAVGYVGEDGIKPNVSYWVVNGQLTEKGKA